MLELRDISYSVDDNGTRKDILKHIKSTGVNALEMVSWTKTDMQKFENGYNNFCSGIPTLTYHPIYVKIENK